MKTKYRVVKVTAELQVIVLGEFDDLLEAANFIVNHPEKNFIFVQFMD